MTENTSTSTVSQDRRPIPGYDGLYEIDQAGNVYAMFPFKGLPSGRLRKPGVTTCGYHTIWLSKNKKGTSRSLHRIMLLTWNPIENSDEFDVNHIDGDKTNNALSNLEWMTHADNMRHAGEVLNAWQKRNQRGDTAGYRKLTEDKVREIRRLWATGSYTQTEISALYGVTSESISGIVRRKFWKSVE